ncbi:MAG: adenylate/guanylate cyclase domain-containing protein [Stappiaceae bacterium]
MPNKLDRDDRPALIQNRPVPTTDDSVSASDFEQTSPRFKLSIGAALGVGFALLLTLVGGGLIAMLMIAANKQTASLMDEVGNLMLSRSTQVVADHLTLREKRLKVLSDVLLAETIDLDQQELEHLLTNTLADLNDARRITLNLADGRRYITTKSGFSATQDNDWKPAERPQETGSAAFIWDEPRFDPELNETVIGLNTSTYQGSRFVGDTRIEYSVASFLPLLKEMTWRDQQTAFILFGKDQVIAYDHAVPKNFKATAQTPLPTLEDMPSDPLSFLWTEGPNYIQRTQKTETPDHFVGSHLNSTSQGMKVYFYTDLSAHTELPFIVGSFLPASDFGSAFRSLQNVTIAGALVLGVAVILVFFLGRAIGRPINRLAKAALAVRELDLEHVERLPRSSFRELDEANRAFNAASGALLAFARYVPRDLVNTLISSDFSALEKTELREMTILFTDIAGFTGTAAAMSAEETADFLNHHFEELTSCISQTQGTIDKYVGDGIMAFWGAPSVQHDHAQRAADAIGLITKKIRQSNELNNNQIRVRIGVHTGKVVVGNIGSQQRMNYTVIGDAVNVAARLQELGKEVDQDADVIALGSEETIERLQGNRQTSAIGQYLLRGRDRKTTVYRIS